MTGSSTDGVLGSGNLNRLLRRMALLRRQVLEVELAVEMLK